MTLLVGNARRDFKSGLFAKHKRNIVMDWSDRAKAANSTPHRMSTYVQRRRGMREAMRPGFAYAPEDQHFPETELASNNSQATIPRHRRFQWPSVIVQGSLEHSMCSVCHPYTRRPSESDARSTATFGLSRQANSSQSSRAFICCMKSPHDHRLSAWSFFPHFVDYRTVHGLTMRLGSDAHLSMSNMGSQKHSISRTLQSQVTLPSSVKAWNDSQGPYRLSKRL